MIKLGLHHFASRDQILLHTHNVELLSFSRQLTFRRPNPVFVTGAIIHFFTLTSLSTVYVCTMFFILAATRICCVTSAHNCSTGSRTIIQHRRFIKTQRGNKITSFIRRRMRAHLKHVSDSLPFHSSPKITAFFFSNCSPT